MYIKALDALYVASNIEVNGESVNIMDELMKSEKELSVVEKTNGGSHFAYGRDHISKDDWKDGKAANVIGTIHFNSNDAVMFDDTNDAACIEEFYDKNGKLRKTVQVNSPTSILGHELSHAYNFMDNPDEFMKRKKDFRPRELTPYFKNAEEAKATTMSTQININLKENPRKNYHGTSVKTKGVLSNVLQR